MKNKINIIIGPTASGKTSYSIDLAHKIDGEIINFDSMQVYKEIPIISAQPTRNERKGINHHLFGSISINEKFSVATWLYLAIDCISKIKSSGKTPILVGGTGMYAKALIEGLAPTPKISSLTKNKVLDYKKNLDTNGLYNLLGKLDSKSCIGINNNDSQRITRALEIFLETGQSLKDLQRKSSPHKFNREDFHIIKIEKPRDVIYQNINYRFEQMISNGAIEEANIVFNKFQNIDYPKAIGLIELIDYLKGDITISEAVKKSQQLSRNYAKRQITWMNHQIDKYDEVINSAS
jgi:tRNA dimethylallyltransferase